MKKRHVFTKILIVAGFSLICNTAFAGDAISDAFEDTFGHDKIPNAFEDTFGHNKIPNAYESAFGDRQKKPAAKPHKTKPEKAAPET
jgi:hypothetical protein